MSGRKFGKGCETVRLTSKAVERSCASPIELGRTEQLKNVQNYNQKLYGSNTIMEETRCTNGQQLPLTSSSAVKLTSDAMFDARHVKLPACLPVTESMVNTEFRLPILAVVMPAISLTERPLKSHRKSTGRSPDVTRHCILAESPKLDGPSPKLKAAIFGGAEGGFVHVLLLLLNRLDNCRQQFVCHLNELIVLSLYTFSNETFRRPFTSRHMQDMHFCRACLAMLYTPRLRLPNC